MIIHIFNGYIEFDIMWLMRQKKLSKFGIALRDAIDKTLYEAIFGEIKDKGGELK